MKDNTSSTPQDERFAVEDNDQVLSEADDGEVEGERSSKIAVQQLYGEKLKELLRNLCSIEVKICSEASKEFIKLLRSDPGGKVLHEYVLSSPSCTELMEVWKLRQGKPGMQHVLYLIADILDHPDGKYKSGDLRRIAISKRLDKVARLVLETKLSDVYTELNSKDGRHQDGALLLMAAVVRRGVGLASEAAKNFDFKLPVFSKLAEYQNKKVGKKVKYTTRRSFIEFAMSFLEIGNPRLLRWVLQKKEMYSGVFCGLGYDDDETIVFVLSTLRDRVLTPESLVPPGLRSVLFGSVTLEQLIKISENPVGGPSAEIAYDVLVMVCTDPHNGLMPDMKSGHTNSLKGNPKRLLDLMKKLTATETGYHRDLLLAIVNGRPSLGSAYMDEFPYILEPRVSSSWFAAISLASDLIASTRMSSPFGSITSLSCDPPSLDSSEVQYILKCIVPRAFGRIVINRGLLHSDVFVRHGSIRFLLEALKSFDSLIGAIGCSSPKWVSLKQEIQDEVRASLPDPQVLFKLLSSMSHSDSKAPKMSLKRPRASEKLPEDLQREKKLKPDMAEEDVDILISGVNMEPGNNVFKENGKEELNTEKDCMEVISGIWGLKRCTATGTELKDAETYFHSKLLDVLTLYLRTLPTIVEGSFDFFEILPEDPFTLSISQQQSLLSLLIEYIRWSPEINDSSTRPPDLMYKHLRSLIKLLIYSPVKGIQDQAYILTRAAMLSTGGFDRNLLEIDVWLLFLPGYRREMFYVEGQSVEVFRDLSAAVISFLCDTVSIVGNNLYKYLDNLRVHISNLKEVKDVCPDCSPLVICILNKCLKMLDSPKEEPKLHEKSMILVYICNTLGFLLQTQVRGGLLSTLINSILIERFPNASSVEEDLGSLLCEWRPLKNLFLFSKGISDQQACSSLLSLAKKRSCGNTRSFLKALNKAKKVLKREGGETLDGEIKSFCSSIICSTTDEILENFPLVISISQSLLGVHHTFLSYKVFSEQSLFGKVSDLWPTLFFSGLKLASKETSSSMDDDSMEPASVAFGSFLKQVSFHILFPAILGLENSKLLGSTEVLNFLKVKLSEGSIEDYIASLRRLLFWVHQIRSSYRVKPLEELKHLSLTCFILLKHLLLECLTVKSDSVVQYIREVIETIVQHPAVCLFLSVPLNLSENLTNGSTGTNFKEYLSSSNSSIHPMDHDILHLLIITGDYLLNVDQSSIHNKKAVKAFKTVVEQVVLSFRNEFDICVKNKDLMPLLPNFYVLQAVSHFISPFVLMELGHWMFCEAERNESINLASSIGCYIAEKAFKLLQVNLKTTEFAFLWDLKEETFNVAILKKVYHKVLGLATKFNVESADLCLLKAVNVTYKMKFVQPPKAVLSSIMALSRVIRSTHFQVLTHCIWKPNVTKAKLLFRLTEVSPLHLALSGNIFSCVTNKESHLIGNFFEEISTLELSNEDLIMFLPVALSYLNLNFKKFGVRVLKHFESIPSFYSKILLDGFLNWDSYSSGYVYQEEYDASLPLPSSTQEFLHLFSSTLLGKAICMLRYYFTLNEDSVRIKKRMKLFNSLYPHSGVNDDLFGCKLSEINVCSHNDSLNIINKVIAKISFSKILLSPEEITRGGEGSESEGHAKMRFISILVKNLHNLAKNIPLLNDSSEKVKSTEVLLLFRHLEVLILENIVELSKEAEKHLTELPSLPFLEKFTKSSLLYRFEDPTTLKVLRSLLTILSKGKFSSSVVFELLLSHSQFMATILWSNSTSDPSGVSHVGTLLRPISSILKSHALFIDQNGVDNEIIIEASSLYKRKLELIKLLRVLHAFKACEDGISHEEDASMNSRELLALLLSSYGATVSEIDLEIFDLMHEIVSVDGSVSVAEMDYLWGSSALKLRREKELEKMISSNDINNCEAAEKHRRRQFRENLNLNPGLIVVTILHFPYDRVACNASKSAQKLQEEDAINTGKKETAGPDIKQRYDPSFILRLSVHSLSMGYLEPLEFAGLGLLAIACMSISSPDEGIRKQGYEVLGKFKISLENSRLRKEGLRLRLLLTYLQNGIEKPWQRIPSVIAIFAAEASFVLLDPSHDHYLTISKLLMRSSRVNLKSVPLFYTMFDSISVNFRTDRLWILRLSYAGLNLDDDGQIFMWKNLLETLLKFYNSSLSDNESSVLILQIVKKAVQLPTVARYLVEHCGLVLWLSSVLSFCGQRLYDDEKSPFITQVKIVFEVVNSVISLESITEWLEKYAFEQLSELSSHVYNLLLASLTKMKQNVASMLQSLQILVSTLRISQKRNLYQSHFTLSFEDLFELYQALEDFGPSAELGLTAILMRSPPRVISDMDEENMLKFVVRGISTASLTYRDRERFFPEESHIHLTSLSTDQNYEESPVSKLLRWVSASVILGQISTLERSSIKNLQSLLEQTRKERNKGKDNDCSGGHFRNDHVLATTILYLQQLLGLDCRFLPSVISALCLLLLYDASNNPGGDSLVGAQSSMVSPLCSRIRCPPEANPAWRWSFDQPWEDFSSELTDLQKMDELHACQSLLIIFSNYLDGNSSNSQALSHLDVESWGIFTLERNIITSE
ncbi:hypothetical protein GIB67_011437 [Kingdonia uniflora]|uniref:Nucleolar pre-ribosomal-associated protein 1 n=1 Tax=Kingdonia uniflora TaxID=39325 RepID=A0A7J7NM77_9MAGN|nr:hypothetical protein GIB67_011437 [Kingdonia uniflora]